MNNQELAKMNKQTLLNFRAKEIELREKFRAARKELESLVNEVSKHNREFCKFFMDIYDDAEEILVSDPEQPAQYFLIKRPEREDASCESYLPYSVDYKSFIAI